MLDQKIIRYTAFFEPAEEGGYIVYVPSLPGLVTQGNTLKEAKEMAKDAIEGYLAVLKEDGEKFPEEPEETIISKIKIDLVK